MVAEVECPLFRKHCRTLCKARHKNPLMILRNPLLSASDACDLPVVWRKSRVKLVCCASHVSSYWAGLRLGL